MLGVPGTAPRIGRCPGRDHRPRADSRVRRAPSCRGIRALLARFEDLDTRNVVLLKLKGHSCLEIAATLGTSVIADRGAAPGSSG